MSKETNGINSHKIFDEYEVDCNTCESYWNNQCDGVKVGTTRNCNSYKATKKVDILDSVSELKHSVKYLTISSISITLAFLIHLIGEYLC